LPECCNPKAARELMSIYTRDELIAALARGENFQYVFFWGHRPDERGVIGPSCCSQWFEAGFELDGIFYPTAEHFMMAEKARLFGDKTTLAKIIAAQTPQDAKGLGRKVKEFDSEVWERECTEIVVRGNHAKFAQNPRLKAWLLGTAPMVLVEASPVDAIWGIGLHRDDKRSGNPYDWQGSNLLGFALMRVRDLLAETL
jgi:ribA/ribD-fused uncharacterized protein